MRSCRGLNVRNVGEDMLIYGKRYLRKRKREKA